MQEPKEGGYQPTEEEIKTGEEMMDPLSYQAGASRNRELLIKSEEAFVRAKEEEKRTGQNISLRHEKRFDASRLTEVEEISGDINGHSIKIVCEYHEDSGGRHYKRFMFIDDRRSDDERRVRAMWNKYRDRARLETLLSTLRHNEPSYEEGARKELEEYRKSDEQKQIERTEREERIRQERQKEVEQFREEKKEGRGKI